jgi:hypothetical protein
MILTILDTLCDTLKGLELRLRKVARSYVSVTRLEYTAIIAPSRLISTASKARQPP